jgi:phage terminase small subunit
MNYKQRAFVEEYLQCWNAAEAARRAGYSEKTARSSGSRLLGLPYIQEEIQRRIAEKAMSADEILLRLAKMGRGDIRELFKIQERWTRWPAPSEEIIDEEIRIEEGPNGEDVEVVYYLVRKVVFDAEAMVDPKRSWMVKKFSDSPKSGFGVEIYDAKDALIQLGRVHGLFTDRQEVTGKDGGPVDMRINDGEYHRAISTLAAAIRESLSGASAKPHSTVDTAEQAAVAGVSDES